MKKFEKVTDMIVFNYLRDKKYVDGDFKNIDDDIQLWAKRSTNKAIDSLLAKSSKQNTGNHGYPEYIIFDKEHNLVIIIENKKDTKKHMHEQLEENIEQYAVNGALWYAKHLKEKFNVIAIGVSGNSVQEILIDTYAWKEKSETFSNLNIHKILEIKGYRDLIFKKKNLDKKKNEVIEINNEAKIINEFLRNYLGVIEHERLYVLGSLLYALDDPVFKMSYSTFNNDEDLSMFVWQTVERKIDGSKISNKDIIKNELKSTLLGLKNAEKEGTKDQFPYGAFSELARRVDTILFEYHKNSELDIISIFFNVFLAYSTSGGSDLGIVLTPSHITKLFTDLAEVDLNSKILDICTGTGGFLTSSWKKISLDNKYTFTEKENFRMNNLFGVEKEKSIYTIVALNMFINRDGKSHLHKGDCFSLKNEIKKFSCNVGFINPPYSDSIYSEISFVELMLDSLLPDSIGVAIIPVNAISSRTKKHNNLNVVKKRILQKHALLASIQMPNNLFYPKGTETVILVFKTHKTHNQPTWFAKFDDGYELLKHQKTRTPTSKATEKYDAFISAYKTRKETSFSFNEVVESDKHWIYTILKTHDYTIETCDLQNTVNEYISYLYKNNYY